MPQFPHGMPDLIHLLDGSSPTTLPDLDARVRTLASMTLELLVEVEALRAERISSARAQGGDPAQSPFAEAYVNTRLLTYDGTGVSCGWDKLLRRWFGRIGTEALDLAMLRRLGFDEQRIQEYQQRARELMARS